MQIEIDVRHMHITEASRAHAMGRAQDLALKFPSIEFIRVVLDHQHDLCSAQFEVQAKGEKVVAKCNVDSQIKAAIDGASAKACKQLRKHIAKIRNVTFRARSLKASEVADVAQVES